MAHAECCVFIMEIMDFLFLIRFSRAADCIQILFFSLTHSCHSGRSTACFPFWLKAFSDSLKRKKFLFSLQKFFALFVFTLFYPQIWDQKCLWFSGSWMCLYMKLFTIKDELEIGLWLRSFLLFSVSIISPGPSSSISFSIYFCDVSCRCK